MDAILFDTESHQGDNWRGNKEGSEIERKVATFFDNNTVREKDKNVFSSQVLLRWENAF